MILQALKEYYDRKAADPESGIAPEGWAAEGYPLHRRARFKGESQTDRRHKGRRGQKKARTIVLGADKG